VRVAFVAIAKECEAVLDAADAPMVEAAAVMLVRARVAGADVEKRGMLVTGRFDTLVENPSVKQERDVWASFRSFAEQLGIGPSARARLAGLAVDGRDASDELEGLGELRAISGGRP
jgi:P27 family predicted phage terminase small subunit